MSNLNKTTISMIINNENYDNITVETRQHLGDFLRDLGFKGTHLGCEQGACGACNVLVDGEAVNEAWIGVMDSDGFICGSVLWESGVTTSIAVCLLCLQEKPESWLKKTHP